MGTLFILLIIGTFYIAFVAGKIAARSSSDFYQLFLGLPLLFLGYSVYRYFSAEVAPDQIYWQGIIGIVAVPASAGGMTAMGWLKIFDHLHD